MGKNNKKQETETDTDTDSEIETETENKSMFSKLNGLSKKTKIFMAIILLLFVAAGIMWYKNRKSQSTQNTNEPIKHLSPVPSIQEVQ